jgi:hypothetical protein
MNRAKTGPLPVCGIAATTVPLLSLFLFSSFWGNNNTIHYVHFKNLMIWHYVQTSALDGETDLKTRVIPPACMGIDDELLHKIKARFYL